MSVERKYTDRDVRENSTLREVAENYVQNYGGDFEPLVNAVEILREGRELPTNIVRVVLNCMRHDHNVCNDLPAPKAAVIPIKKNKKKSPWELDCKFETSHEAHSWEDDDGTRHWCKGVPFPINRKYPTILEAKVKFPYALARTGTLIHKTTGLGYCYWYPRGAHEYGFHPFHAPELRVKTVCKHPSWITQPIPLTEDAAKMLVLFGDIQYKELSRTMCPYCEEGES